MILVGNTAHVLEEELDLKRRATYHVFHRRVGHKLRVTPIWGGTQEQAIATVQRRNPRHLVESISLTEGPL